MGKERYLIDTNVVIDYFGEKLLILGMDFMNVVVDAVPIVSVIIQIELLGFNSTKQH